MQTYNQKRIALYRSKIPFFAYNSSFIYLDSAATALKPQVVIDAVVAYYSQYPANVHRANNTISNKVNQKYEQARDRVKKFFSATDDYEIVFTSGMTEGSNLIAHTHRELLGEQDAIYITELEHHSSALPWIETAKHTKSNLIPIPINNKGSLDVSTVQSLLEDGIDNKKILSITGMSNITGYQPPLAQILQICNNIGCKMIVDVAQLAAHKPIDLSRTPYDAILVTAHKLGGAHWCGCSVYKKNLG